MEKGCTFVCNGKVNLNDFHICKDGPLMRGELDRVMHPANNQKSTVNLFDSIQATSTAILQLGHYTRCMEYIKLYNSTFSSQYSP